MHISSLLLSLVAFAVSARNAYQGSDILATTTSAASTPTVTLDYCTIVPTAGNSSLGYYKYQNICFAAVPTGDLRFAVPQWPLVETTINTSDLADEDVDCSSEEDCLYMDIWAPSNSTSKKLPVIVWTYGGGFTGGSRSQNIPEGLFDLSKEFFFDSYNYRLGLTGLANGPTFLHEGETSNTGIWDVTHASEWTKKYISNFGGDPDHVTVVGFSAGGSQAYVMSPGYIPGAGNHHAEVFWQNVSSAVGCDGGHLDCMRSVDFDAPSTASSDIVSNYTYHMQSRVDGDIVADTYEVQLYQKRFNFSGPCVIRHKQHEAYSQAYSGVDTVADISTGLKIFCPTITDNVIEELLELYPEDDYTSPGLRFANMKQSLDLTGKNLALTQALKNQTLNAMVALGQATHGTDQDYYWYSTYSLSSSSSSSSSGFRRRQSSNSTGPSDGMMTTSVNSTTAVTMQKYLMFFVLIGNPNTLWPQYGNNTSAGTEIIFNTTMYTQADDLANNRSLFWNKALYY